MNELGHAYALKGDYGKAIEIFERAKGVKPKQPTAYNRLGNVFSGQEKYDKALREYNTAKKVAPRHPDSYYNIARDQL